MTEATVAAVEWTSEEAANTKNDEVVKATRQIFQLLLLQVPSFGLHDTGFR
jgi:hypothetical protein